MPKQNTPTKPSTQLWFKAKKYGWGWYPVTWQGWGILFIFVSLIFMNFRRLDSVAYSTRDMTMNFVPQTLVLVLLLIWVCYRTGEKPRWQWGNQTIPKKAVAPVKNTAKAKTKTKRKK